MPSSPLRRVLAVVAAAAAVLALAGPADAANRYTVKGNVAKPSVCNNSGTIAAGGWVANKPCGYVMGTALKGTAFDNHVNTDKGFHYGRTRQSEGSFCTWIVPGAFDLGTKRTATDSCGTGTSDAMRHRRTIGKDFDNKPGVGNGSTTIAVNASRCRGYYNYFTTSDFRKGHLHDAVGYTLPAQGAYRYATRDGLAAMIRTGSGPSTTWLFVSRSCIASQLQGKRFSNLDD